MLTAMGSTNIGFMPGYWGDELGTFGTVLANALNRAKMEIISLRPVGKFNNKLTVDHDGKRKTVVLTMESSAKKVVDKIRKMR